MKSDQKPSITINVESTAPSFDTESSTFIGSSGDDSYDRDKFVKTSKFVRKRISEVQDRQSLV
jgi:hypothetical protein